MQPSSALGVGQVQPPDVIGLQLLLVLASILNAGKWGELRIQQHLEGHTLPTPAVQVGYSCPESLPIVRFKIAILRR